MATVTENFTTIAFDRKPLPPEPPRRAQGGSNAGAAAPTNLAGKASPVLAVPAPLQTSNPLPAALRPGSETGLNAGAAPVAGPGGGAGGASLGSGSGAGGTGTGIGDGDGQGEGGTDPDWTGGRIKNADYPLGARAARLSGTTETSITVSAQGRPIACRINRSSGSRLLDDTTCRLVLQRFRFRPARSSSGQAIAAEVDYDQEWVAPPPIDAGSDETSR